MAASSDVSMRGSSTSTQQNRLQFSQQDELNKFQLLFDNLKQLMAFEEGQKPWIQKDGKLIVDSGSSRLTRWVWGAFNTMYVDDLCQQVFNALINAKTGIEKFKEGKRVGRVEAFSVQKAFAISQLLLNPPKKTNGMPGNSLEAGLSNLMQTYTREGKKQTADRLNTLSFAWIAKLREQSEWIQQEKQNLEKVIKASDRVVDTIKEMSIPIPQAPPSPPSSSSNSPTPPRQIIIPKVHQFKRGIVEEKPVPKSSFLGGIVSRMRRDPHKKDIKKAPPSFLNTFMERLKKRNEKKIDIDEKVQQYKAENTRNRLGTMFNMKMFSRVAAPVEEEVFGDCVWIEEEKPPQLLRTTSVQVLPAPKLTDRLVRASSEVFSEEIVNALQKRFAKAFLEDEPEDWSEEELDVN